MIFYWIKYQIQYNKALTLTLSSNEFIFLSQWVMHITLNLLTLSHYGLISKSWSILASISIIAKKMPAMLVQSHRLQYAASLLVLYYLLQIKVSSNRKHTALQGISIIVKSKIVARVNGSYVMWIFLSLKYELMLVETVTIT